MSDRPMLEDYALVLAAAAATRSEDPKRKVGAAVTGPGGAVLALGYNGPPSGIEVADWGDRNLVRAMTIHAEANALRYVRPGEATMLASTYLPCAECLKTAAAQGIRLVVFSEQPGTPNAWTYHDAARLARDLGLELQWWPPRG